MTQRNDILGYGKVIYQDKATFRFSLDSVLLANFLTVNSKVKRICDLGTGNAVIPLILSTRTKAGITGIELQPNIYNLAIRSVKENNLEQQISIINNDIKDIKQYLENNSYDAVVANPPFFKNSDKLNESESKRLARHEVTIDLEDIIKAGSYLLRDKGYFALVIRPDRLLEVTTLMQKYRIEPKRMQICYPKDNTEANVCLIEGIMNGNPGIKILSPLTIHKEDGEYTTKIKELFKL